MIKNRLKINDDKTEFLVITSPRVALSDEVSLRIGQDDIVPSRSCKSLGVMFDEHIKMDAFIGRNLDQWLSQSVASFMYQFCNLYVWVVRVCKWVSVHTL